MKYFTRHCFFIFFSVVIFVGCGTISDLHPEGEFHILIVSDTHISNDNTKIVRLNELVRRLNQGIIPGISLVINTGDVVSSVYKKFDGSNAGFRESRLFNAVTNFKELKMPFYWAMGNHDYKIDSDRDSDAPYEKSEIMMMEELWKNLTSFDPYFSVYYRGWKFIILNSMRGRYLERNFDDVQLAWLRKELNEQIPVLLFFHHPLETDNFRLWRFSSGLITNQIEPEFYNILNHHNDQIRGIFVGHGHRFMKDKLFDRIPVYETASFGDDDKGPYLIVGLDDAGNRIRTGKGSLY